MIALLILLAVLGMLYNISSNASEQRKERWDKLVNDPEHIAMMARVKLRKQAAQAAKAKHD